MDFSFAKYIISSDQSGCIAETIRNLDQGGIGMIKGLHGKWLCPGSDRSANVNSDGPCMIEFVKTGDKMAFKNPENGKFLTGKLIPKKILYSSLIRYLNSKFTCIFPVPSPFPGQIHPPSGKFPPGCKNALTINL